MAVTALRQLDQHSVAVELVVQGQTRLVKGTAHYEAHGPFGAALRIEVVDPAGNFELLLREDRWNGQITSGQPFGCDYAVLLGATSKTPGNKTPGNKTPGNKTPDNKTPDNKTQDKRPKKKQ